MPPAIASKNAAVPTRLEDLRSLRSTSETVGIEAAGIEGMGREAAAGSAALAGIGSTIVARSAIRNFHGGRNLSGCAWTSRELTPRLNYIANRKEMVCDG